MYEIERGLVSAVIGRPPRHKSPDTLWDVFDDYFAAGDKGKRIRVVHRSTDGRWALIDLAIPPEQNRGLAEGEFSKILSALINYKNTPDPSPTTEPTP